MNLGNYRVGISFNPSGNELVNEIKTKAADLINIIDSIDASAEPNEIIRLKSLAMTHIEDAAMWGVKAAIKKSINE